MVCTCHNLHIQSYTISFYPLPHNIFVLIGLSIFFARSNRSSRVWPMSPWPYPSVWSWLLSRYCDMSGPMISAMLIWPAIPTLSGTWRTDVFINRSSMQNVSGHSNYLSVLFIPLSWLPETRVWFFARRSCVFCPRSLSFVGFPSIRPENAVFDGNPFNSRHSGYHSIRISSDCLGGPWSYSPCWPIKRPV